MKITKQFLKQIIKEELEHTLQEQEVPSLESLLDSVKVHAERGDSFASSSYMPTLKWYLDRHPQSKQLQSLLNQVSQLTAKGNIPLTRSAKTGGLVADPEHPNIKKAVEIVDQMKKLAQQS
jgi:hypothetical protein